MTSFILLSQILTELPARTRHGAYLRALKAAVSQGVIDAAYNGETYATDGGRGREMIIRRTPAFETWHAGAVDATRDRRTGTRRPTLENVSAGLVDFDAMVEETRESLRRRAELARRTIARGG